MSNSVRPQRRQPTRLYHPWDSPGKNTGVGCHFLLQCMNVKSESETAQSCPTLSDPTDCSPPGSSIHGIFQARVLEWGATAFSNKVTSFPQAQGFPGGSVGKELCLHAGDLGSIPGLGRSPGEGHGKPLQYSCLENPTDRGVWRATVHGVARVRHGLVTKPPPPASPKVSSLL